MINPDNIKAGMTLGLCDAIVIKSIITVFNSGQWVKCTDRNPEEGGRYWCYIAEQNSLGLSHYQWNCSWNGEAWSDDSLSGTVTHWQPLPSPPQD